MVEVKLTRRTRASNLQSEVESVTPLSGYVTHGSYVNTYEVRLPLAEQREWLAKKLHYKTPQDKLLEKLSSVHHHSSPVNLEGNRLTVTSGLSDRGKLVVQVNFHFAFPRPITGFSDLGTFFIENHLGEDMQRSKRQIAKLMGEFGIRDEMVRRKLLEVLPKGSRVTCHANWVHYDFSKVAKG